MISEFDKAAVSYDVDFTETKIGLLQRKSVYKNVETLLRKPTKKLNILEVNCGTGQDATFMAKQGHRVFATDISSQMISEATRKVANQKLDNLISLQQADMLELEGICSTSSFDLIFSNFGGLNCLSPSQITEMGSVFSQLLKPQGKLCLVVMPSFCVWECSYFLLKLKLKEAFRRTRKSVFANVSGELVETWYYSPNKFTSLIGNHFIKRKILPIGFFIPPSYLESFFRNKPKTLRALHKLERIFSQFSWLSAWSDHYYIELNKK